MNDTLGPAVVVALYAIALLVILWLPREFVETDGKKTPWWRSIRVAAAVVACAQIIVYAIWG
jgi:hypothetical protein